MDKRVVKDLLNLLDEEREVILEGRFEKLESSSARKSALFIKLNEVSADERSLTMLAATVSRNQALLRAAMRGLADASKRIKDVQRAHGTLSTYNGNGQVSNYTPTKPAFEKKA
ncbi:hypothetical protein [Aestuariibius sp. HNIBRBA575]|uniref:hypothetical protein n=1 Tax=Aestuariibius sp. HNIBRBA575 TaxID=3233343 RepID=UPI0034A46B16